jgi:hypothetical protein
MTASTVPFHYAYESDCLKIRAIGRYIIEQKDAATRAIAAVIADHPVRAALIDLRDVPGPYTFMDRVQLGEAAGKHLAGTPIAVVLHEEQADPERIGKLVARNRGANVEVFTDPAEAQVWVQKYLGPAAATQRTCSVSPS